MIIENRCYIIAEMSANHDQDLGLALEIVHAAKEAGADCIKTQTYTPDTLTINSRKEHFRIKGSIWGGQNFYELYEKAYMPWDWNKIIKDEAEKIGLDFLSSAYDKTSVDFLGSIGVDTYKIASFEMIDYPFLEYVAKTGKTIILSTGMASFAEIDHAVNRCDINNLILLWCNSSYPADKKNMNLKTMSYLGDKYNCVYGLSDHTLDSVSAEIAVSMGASVIEKHFKVDRVLKSPDKNFSMNPKNFKNMVNKIREIEEIKGEVTDIRSEKENVSKQYRRSIFAIQDIQIGEQFTELNIATKRPATGMAPENMGRLLKSKSNKLYEVGDPII